MSRWIVTHVPSGLILMCVMVIVAGGAVLVSMFVRRRFTALTRDEHNDVLKFTYGFIGFIYAFFIGFVVSSMWGRSTPPTPTPGPRARPRSSCPPKQADSIPPRPTGSGTI